MEDIILNFLQKSNRSIGRSTLYTLIGVTSIVLIACVFVVPRSRVVPVQDATQTGLHIEYHEAATSTKVYARPKGSVYYFENCVPQSLTFSVHREFTTSAQAEASGLRLAKACMKKTSVYAK